MNFLKKLQGKNQDQLQGRLMRRRGEARRRLLMEDLEPRMVMANYVLSGTVGADVSCSAATRIMRPWPRCRSTA